MAISSATVTMNLADLLGVDFDIRRTKVWVSTNIPGNAVIDTVGNQIRLGTGSVTLNADGTASLSTWIPGSGANPASWQTYVNVDYRDSGSRERVTRVFGPFTITGNADLADLVAEQEIPPTYLSEVTGVLNGYVTTAAASAAAAASSAADAAASAADLDNIQDAADLIQSISAPGLQIVSKRGRWPVMSITTDNAAPILSKDDYVNGDYTITDTDTGIIQSGGLRIRGRGNSTWFAPPKKPYRLNFDVATSPLGMTASQRNWALLANWYDPSKINNAFAMHLGQQLTGLTWTPQYRFVEVVLNGTFLGIYQLADLVKMEAGRLALTAATGTTGDARTGAYLLEVDQRMEVNNEPGWRTSQNVPIIYDTPETPNSTQAAYIQGWINNFEAALFGTNFLDPVNGYLPFIDIDSFADWYNVNELLKNGDSWFFASCKMFKTRDAGATPGKLHMGPLWDFDLSFGVNTVGASPSPYGLVTRAGTWFARLFQDPAFRAHAATRFALMITAVGDYATWIDQSIDQLSEAIQRDGTKWDTGAVSVAEADNRKVWLAQRIAWLTGQYAAPYSLYAATYAATY